MSKVKGTNGIRLGIYDHINLEKFTKHLILHVNEYHKASNNNDIIFFCIGTDSSTGDSFAPFIGTMLEEKGYKNVIETIDYPVHALNLNERVKEIPKDSTVIAVDASLTSNPMNIGKIVFNEGKLFPGLGIGKNLTPVGDFNICGVINKAGNNTLSSTRLSIVLKMARDVVNVIEEAFPLTISINDVMFVNN